MGHVLCNATRCRVCRLGPQLRWHGPLQKIRRDLKSPNPFVPIIIVTSMSDKKNVLTARDLGMTEFLAKPFSQKQIYLGLRIVAEQPRASIKTGNFFGPDRRRQNLGVQKNKHGEGNDNQSEAGDDAPTTKIII